MDSMIVLSFIKVNDLNKFIDYLNNFNIDVDEYGHIVLPDSSEYTLLICKKSGRVIAYIAVHYIDSHYAALNNLSENASDKEIIEALINAQKSGVWRVPVEPIIYVATGEFIELLSRYSDDIPRDAAAYINQYRGETDLLKGLASSIVNLARYLGQNNM